MLMIRSGAGPTPGITVTVKVYNEECHLSFKPGPRPSAWTDIGKWLWGHLDLVANNAAYSLTITDGQPS